MAAPTCLNICFMVLLSLAICSAQPIEVHSKAMEVDHHHNHKAHTLSNIDVQGFGGGGSDGGLGIGGGGGGFGIGVGVGVGVGGGRFGFGIGGGVPGYIPGFDFPVYSPDCGYVCLVNNPSGEITEFKISGLSHFTKPYRCRPGPNMRGHRDFNHELLLNFVSTMQDKQQNLHYGGHGGDVGHHVVEARRLGFGRGSSRATGGSDTSDQYANEDLGWSIEGCGYVCPGNSPSGGITEFHISGISHFSEPYRCSPDVCDTEECGEFLLRFVSPMHNKHENQHGHQTEQQDKHENKHGHQSDQHDKHENQHGHQSDQHDKHENQHGHQSNQHDKHENQHGHRQTSTTNMRTNMVISQRSKRKISQTISPTHPHPNPESKKKKLYM